MFDFDPIEEKIRKSLSDAIVDEDPNEYEIGFGICTEYSDGSITINPFPQEFFIPDFPFFDEWINQAKEIDTSEIVSFTLLIPSRVRVLGDDELSKETFPEGAIVSTTSEKIEDIRASTAPALMCISMSRDSDFEVRYADLMFLRNEPILLGKFRGPEDVGNNQNYYIMRPVEGLWNLLND